MTEDPSTEPKRVKAFARFFKNFLSRHSHGLVRNFPGAKQSSNKLGIQHKSDERSLLMQTVSRPKLCLRNLTRDRGVQSNCRSRIAAALLAIVSLPASAAILHVSTVSPSPTPPYA